MINFYYDSRESNRSGKKIWKIPPQVAGFSRLLTLKQYDVDKFNLDIFGTAGQRQCPQMHTTKQYVKILKI